MCEEHALSSIPMSPLASPNDYSPLKPASSIEFNKIIDDLDSIINNTEGINSDAVMLIEDKKTNSCWINHIDPNSWKWM